LNTTILPDNHVHTNQQNHETTLHILSGHFIEAIKHDRVGSHIAAHTQTNSADRQTMLAWC
jgi:hypothetical protein